MIACKMAKLFTFFTDQLNMDVAIMLLQVFMLFVFCDYISTLVRFGEGEKASCRVIYIHD